MLGRRKSGVYLEGEKYKKKRFNIPIRNSLISVVVLVVVFGALGAIYTWLNGRNANVADVEGVATEPVQTFDTLEPNKPAPDAVVNVSVQGISSPVKPGDNASIHIRTNADATCTISVTYNKVPSKDTGLTPKIADKYGNVSWSWKVEATAPEGKWPVKVDCANIGKSGMVIGDLVVKKK